MRNEDELMIALDIIKTYSEASQAQAKSTVQSELAELIAEFKKSTDKFWNDSAYVINTLKDQVDRNRWKHTMIFSMSAAVIFGLSILGIFMWLPSLDEIKQRRASIEYLTPTFLLVVAKHVCE